MMADIASALNNLSRAVMASMAYHEVKQIEPYNITPLLTPSSVTKNIGPAGLNVSYITFMVRSMGTATYVSIRAPSSDRSKLTAVGDVFEVSAHDHCYINAAKIMCDADVADAVIEVSGVLIPKGVITIED